jgi:hypothetical protein
LAQAAGQQQGEAGFGQQGGALGHQLHQGRFIELVGRRGLLLQQGGQLGGQAGEQSQLG